MKFSNKVYDALKWIAQYLLPAAGALYFALAGIWGLPYGEQIIGTISAVDIFLGVILGISSASYNKEFQQFNVPISALNETGRVIFTVDPNILHNEDNEEANKEVT